MTMPNRHLPNQVTHLTRRTTQRQFLLKNSKDGKIKNDIGFLFALSCHRHNQAPHAVTVMSNHHHVCITDNNGKRSDFLRDFHHLTAKSINKSLNRRESLWASASPGNTLLLDTEVIVKTMLYIWLNPVEAGLVSKVEEWEHFQILPKHWGKPMRFKRPDLYAANGDDKKIPEYIEITPMPPRIFPDLSLEDVIAHFERRINEEEQRIFAERKTKGKAKVLGMAYCFKQNPFSAPKKSVPMYSRNPRFSASKVETVVLAVQRMRSFWRAYRKRFQAFKGGVKVKFPPGAIMMRDRFGMVCAKLGREDPHCPIYAPFQF